MWVLTCLPSLVAVDQPPFDGRLGSDRLLLASAQTRDGELQDQDQADRLLRVHHHPRRIDRAPDPALVVSHTIHLARPFPPAERDFCLFR